MTKPTPSVPGDTDLRVAIIGSGPAGIYAADALLKSDRPVSVDVIDGLPTPYGLVRYGVAPDHLKIKSVERTLRGVLEDPRARFIGNVTFGTDLCLDDLRTHYDATVLATGAPQDRRLNVPGEDLPGSAAAAEFVAWYCGHPGYPPRFPLRAREVAVIGAGNVALDVARFLAKDADELSHTDVPDDVLAAVRDNPVTDIHVIARRGPAQAKFTLVELREMGELAGADVVVHRDELALDAASEQAIADKRQIRNMVELFDNWSRREPTGAKRRVHFRFLRRPVEITGTDGVTGVRLERLELDGTGQVRGTGELDLLPAQLVVRSIGYRGTALPKVPFDSASGTVPNADGRVHTPEGEPVPGLYVAGWIKRGPTGVIGTNKGDATGTVRSLLADMEAAGPNRPRPPEPDPEAVTELLRVRDVGFVTWDGWLHIDASEMERGEAQGRARAKIADLEAMIAASRRRE